LIRTASELGAGAVLLGIGGSATHDLGLGALSALGFEFRGADGAKIRPPVPAQWPRLTRIEGALYPSIPPIRIACDVSNPLLGPRGAAAVYAPQKGLLPEDFERLEAATARMAALLIAASGASPNLPKLPGAGAAGGISFGLMAAAGALVLPGFELVSAWLNLEARVASADLVVTGEGRFDESSSEGKGPGAVAAQARRLGRPAHVFAGEIRGKSAAHLHAITPEGMPLDRALREARANLTAEVRRIF
jgi:glycerate kinase